MLCTNFHLLLLCLRGAPSQMVEFKEFHYQPGTLLWIPPGIVHERVPNFVGRDVCFTSAFAGPELADGPVGGFRILSGEDLDGIEALWRVLDHEYNRYIGAPLTTDFEGSEALLRHILLALIRRIQAVSCVRLSSDVPNALVRAFLRLARDECGRMQSVEEFAQALGCSARTLRRLCYKEIGVTPRKVINQQLTEAAKRLLATTDMPLNGIARLLGFSDPSNFSRFFRREIGFTPGAYHRAVLDRVEMDEEIMS